MEYPFKFRELLITSTLIDVLGFTEPWDDCGGVSATRSLLDKGGLVVYRLTEYYENPDVDEGYGENPMYTSLHHNKFGGYTGNDRMYFIHELYEDIAEKAPEYLQIFIEKTKEKGVNVFPYIKYYLEFKEEQNHEKK